MSDVIHSLDCCTEEFCLNGEAYSYCGFDHEFIGVCKDSFCVWLGKCPCECHVKEFDEQ